MKTCKRCGQEKTLRNFREAHAKNGRLYRASYCYDCHREYMHAWRHGEWDKLHPHNT